MPRYLSLYAWFLRQQLHAWMQYRVNFVIAVISSIILQSTGLLTVWIVMRQIPSIHGWTFDDIILIYGLVLLAHAITQIVSDNLWSLGHFYIGPGDFDRFLLRPVEPLFYLLAQGFSTNGVGDLLMGLMLVGHSLAVLPLHWTALQAVYVVIAVVSGAGIFSGINLISAVSVFWLTDASPLMGAIYEMKQFVRFPLNIYNRGIRLLLTWLIPYGFVSYYPAGYLLNRGTAMLAWIAPLVATLALLAGYQFWNFGLRHYTSTGS